MTSRVRAVLPLLLLALAAAAAAAATATPPAHYSGRHREQRADGSFYDVDLVAHLTILDKEPGVLAVHCTAAGGARLAAAADVMMVLRPDALNLLEARLVPGALLNIGARFNCLGDGLPVMRRVTQAPVRLTLAESAGLLLRSTSEASPFEAFASAKILHTPSSAAPTSAVPLFVRPNADIRLSDTTVPKSLRLHGIDADAMYEDGQTVRVWWDSEGFDPLLTVHLSVLVKYVPGVDLDFVYSDPKHTDSSKLVRDGFYEFKLQSSWVSDFWGALIVRLTVGDTTVESPQFKIHKLALSVNAPSAYTVVSPGKEVTLEWSISSDLPAENAVEKVVLMHWQVTGDDKVAELTVPDSLTVGASGVTVELPDLSADFEPSVFPYYLTVKYNCERSCGGLDLCLCTAKSPFLSFPKSVSMGWNINDKQQPETPVMTLMPPFKDPHKNINCVAPSSLEEKMRCAYQSLTGDPASDPLLVNCVNCWMSTTAWLSKIALDLSPSFSNERGFFVDLKRFEVVVNASLDLSLGLDVNAAMSVDTAFRSSAISLKMRPQVLTVAGISFAISMDGDLVIDASIYADAHGALGVRLNGSQPLAVLARLGSDFEREQQGVRAVLDPVEGDLEAGQLGGEDALQGEMNVTLGIQLRLDVHITRYLDLMLRTVLNVQVDVASQFPPFEPLPPIETKLRNGKSTQQLKKELKPGSYLLQVGSCNQKHAMQFHVTLGVPNLEVSLAIYLDWVPLISLTPWKDGLSFHLDPMTIATSRLLEGCALPVTNPADVYSVALDMDLSAVLGELFMSLDSIETLLKLGSSSDVSTARGTRLQSVLPDLRSAFSSVLDSRFDFCVFSWLPKQISRVLDVPQSRVRLSNMLDLSALRLRIGDRMVLPPLPSLPNISLAEQFPRVLSDTEDLGANVTFARMLAKLDELSPTIPEISGKQLAAAVKGALQTQLSKLINRTQLIVQLLPPMTLDRTGSSAPRSSSLAAQLIGRLANLTGFTLGNSGDEKSTDSDVALQLLAKQVNVEATLAAPANRGLLPVDDARPAAEESESWFAEHKVLSIAVGAALGALLLGAALSLATRKRSPARPPTSTSPLHSREIKVQQQQQFELNTMEKTPPIEVLQSPQSQPMV